MKFCREKLWERLISGFHTRFSTGEGGIVRKVWSDVSKARAKGLSAKGLAAFGTQQNFQTMLDKTVYHLLAAILPPD